jgi:allantoinase
MSIVDRSDLYPWSPIVERPALRWPGGRPVAVGVVVLLEYAGVSPSVSAPGASSLRVPPNLLFRSHREYGHRVGIFRLLDAMTEYGLPVSVAVDGQLARRYPFAVDSCAEHRAEFLAHGMQVDQALSSAFGEDDERACIVTARDLLAARTGAAVAGWFGPEQSE